MGTGSRRPLHVQLIHDSSVQDWDCKIGSMVIRFNQFTYTGDTQIPFAEVHKQVIKLNKDMGNAVSADPIRLQIKSQHVLNFSFWDLPGITAGIAL